jgi:hypothetical protein
MVNFEGEREDYVSFPARLRAGGGSGASVQVTIPRDVVNLLGLKEGDYVQIYIKKITLKRPPKS